MGDTPTRGVLLVTVDSLRADALTPEVAPTLSEVASQATMFDRAFAHGNWTPFSFPSLLASRPVFSDAADIGLPGSPSLAEVLRDSGITTAGFNAANGFLTSHWDYDRGFDRFDSFITDPDGRVSKYLAAHPTVQGWIQLAGSPIRRVRNALGTAETRPPFVDVSHLGDVERRATRFLETAEEPFFLWIHYMDAHTPYVPAPKHLKAVGTTGANVVDRLRAHVKAGLGRTVSDATLSALRSLYRGAVHQVDASVGRLLEVLEANGLRDSTAVVVTGDHGEEFQEHGHLAHYPKLYDELVRVPLLIDHPDGEPRRVSRPVGHEAIPATTCAMMDVDASAFEGESLLPTVRNGMDPGQDPVTSIALRGTRITQQPIPRRLTEGEVLVSARTARFTYIYHADSGRKELYDRTEDPDEQQNCYDGNRAPPSVVEQLQEAVAGRIRDLDGDTRDARPSDREMAAGLDDRLEALGYR